MWAGVEPRFDAGRKSAAVEVAMSKGMDRKKETKKKPARTKEEKRAAKAAKAGRKH